MKRKFRRIASLLLCNSVLSAWTPFVLAQGNSAVNTEELLQSAASSSIPANVESAKNENSRPKKSPTMLYGRIEELSSGAGAKFPSLKAQVPQMDNSLTLKAKTQKTALNSHTSVEQFSGSVTKTYPTNFQGQWGGKLKLWANYMSPICWNIDKVQADRTHEMFKPGVEGTANFNFTSYPDGRTYLQPADIVFSFPMQEDHLNQILGSSGGMSMPGLGLGSDSNAMMKQMMMSVPDMVAVHLGSTSGSLGLSGGSVDAQVLKNEIRQLSPGVLEQQIVSQTEERNPKTGVVHVSYAEDVTRFTYQGANQLYVQCATVSFNKNKQFEKKMIFYGMVQRGNVQAQMPIGGMNAQNLLQGYPGMGQNSPYGGGGQGQLMQQMQQLLNQLGHQ